jgi:hypothetical protein
VYPRLSLYTFQGGLEHEPGAARRVPLDVLDKCEGERATAFEPRMRCPESSAVSSNTLSSEHSLPESGIVSP